MWLSNYCKKCKNICHVSYIDDLIIVMMIDDGRNKNIHISQQYFWVVQSPRLITKSLVNNPFRKTCVFSPDDAILKVLPTNFSRMDTKTSYTTNQTFNTYSKRKSIIHNHIHKPPLPSSRMSNQLTSAVI